MNDSKKGSKSPYAVLASLSYRPIKSLSNPQPTAPMATTKTQWPRPIPEDKLEEVIPLYRKYLEAKAAEVLRQRSTLPASGYHPYNLEVPTARSTTSRSIRRTRGLSVSTTSDCDAFTDASSMVDWDGGVDQSTSQSVTGKVVKKHKRQPFNDVKKYKAHLIRILIACPECSGKKLTCDLEKHHDVAQLQRIIDERDSQSFSQHPSSSTSTSGSQHTARHSVGAQLGVPPSSANEFLQGIGAQLPQEEIRSPGEDVLEEISATLFRSDGLQRQLELERGTALYSNYTHGSKVVIGFRLPRGFQCNHASGCTFPAFADVEELETHFETVHFPYTRIDPPIRHVCTYCKEESDSAYMTCPTCQMTYTLQTQVQGHFIRAADDTRDPGDGPTAIHVEQTPNNFFAPLYSLSVMDVEAGPSTPGGNDYDQGSWYGDAASDFDPYGGTNDQTFGGFNGFGGPPTDDGSYHGSFIMDLQQFALEHSVSRGMYLYGQRHSHRLKQLLLLLTSLVMLVVCLAHDEIIGQMDKSFPRSAEIQEHLPMIGFIVIFLGFGASFLVKHFIKQPRHSNLDLTTCTALRAIDPYKKRYTRPGRPRPDGCKEILRYPDKIHQHELRKEHVT